MDNNGLTFPWIERIRGEWHNGKFLSGKELEEYKSGRCIGKVAVGGMEPVMENIAGYNVAADPQEIDWEAGLRDTVVQNVIPRQTTVDAARPPTATIRTAFAARGHV